MLAGLSFLTALTLRTRLWLPGRPALALLTGGLSSLGLPGLLAAPFARRGTGSLLVLSLRRRAGLSLALSALVLSALALSALALSALALSALVLSALALSAPVLSAARLSAAILPSLSVLILVHAGALWERTRITGENTGVR